MAASKAGHTSSQGRLVRKFENLPSQSHSSAWSELWDQGQSDLWDRGCPSPSLVDLLEDRRDMFKPRTKEGRRKTALVPGCGRGYDVVLLALHGYDAYGLEISAAAVAAGKDYSLSQFENPSTTYFTSQSDEEVAACLKDRGEAQLFCADFFDKDWAGNGVPSQYDLVYDYTFFCALPPNMRKQWGLRMSEILYPDGYLVCLEFPLYKDPAIVGPPWGVGGGVYWDLLVRGGTGIVDVPIPQEMQDSQCNNSNGSFVRALRIKPERSHVAGKGTDMLSVWSRK